MPAKKEPKVEDVTVMKVERRRIEVSILGDSPMICNSMNSHTAKELIFPSPKKNAAEKAATLKHDPIAEYRRSPYFTRDGQIAAVANAFKKSMATAALYLPGTNKTAILRQCWVRGERVRVFGKPFLFMAPVVQAGQTGAPDIRTRAIIPEWACTIEIDYTHPIIKEQTVVNLLAAAGMMSGIGDWRAEKGGNYGQFKIVSPDDKEFVRICSEQDADVQAAALQDPEAHGAETEELWSWFRAEVRRRGFEVVA